MEVTKEKQTVSFTIIFLVVCLDLIGFGIVLPLLPVYARSFGATPFVIGLLAISYSATQLLFIPVWGALSDYKGRRPILLISLTGAVIFYTLFGWASSLFWLFVARTGAGIFAGNLSAAMAYIADITSSENRARGMGLIGAAFGLGFIIGPAIGGFLSRYSYSVPGYGAACLSLSALVLAVFKLPESLKPENRKQAILFSYQSVLKPIRDNIGRIEVARPMLVYFIGVLAFSCMQITFPLFTTDVFHFDVVETGYLLAFIAAIVAVFQGGFIGRLSQTFGEGPLALVGIVLSVIGIALLPIAHTVWVLLLALTILGIGTGLHNPTLTSLISIGADDSEQGAVIGVSRSLNTFARIIGPLWGGWAYGAIGYMWTYWMAALVILMALFVGFPLFRMRPGCRKSVVNSE